MFAIGQRVTPITTPSAEERGSGVPLPRMGEVYTVYDRWVDVDGDWQVDLVEMPHPGGGGWAPGYKASGFRPVKTTSIDVFTAMLAPEPNTPARRKVEEGV